MTQRKLASFLPDLRERRVMIVEDEYLVAADLARFLTTSVRRSSVRCRQLGGAGLLSRRLDARLRDAGCEPERRNGLSGS